MNDNDYLDDLMKNIENQMRELNKFESGVLARPNTDGKRELLKAINVNRDKLAELANSVVLPRSE